MLQLHKKKRIKKNNNTEMKIQQFLYLPHVNIEELHHLNKANWFHYLLRHLQIKFLILTILK